MNVFHRLVIALTILIGSAGVAGATIYHGFPHLHLTMAVVDAGGGAANFDSRHLIRTLDASAAPSENARLVKRFGAARVASFYSVFTFAVDDAVKTAHNMLIPLPKSAQPDPKDGPALAKALYQAGVTPSGRYDVGYMLEMLMSHQIHHDIMGDMDKKFSPPVNADFHVILTSAMNDYQREYQIARK
jgi:hypothetical protein